MPMRLAWLKDLRLTDLPQVGGKNASLGEMTAALAAAGIRVPGGFATTADAFREFLSANDLERGKPGIVRLALGSKLQKMVFASAQSAGKSTRTVEVPEAERDRFSLTDAEVLELAR